MLWVFVVLSVVGVFLIAAITVGREAHRLDAVAPRAVYVIEDAVDFVADRLPQQSQARLTHDELAELLRAHLQWLHAKGLQPDEVVDRRQDIDTPVVMEEDTVVAFILGAADDLGIELLDDADVVNVVEAHLDYFEAIGAIGPSAAPDEVIGLPEA